MIQVPYTGLVRLVNVPPDYIFRAVKPVIFLLESSKMDETAIEVLKQLSHFKKKIYFVPVNEFLHPGKCFIRQKMVATSEDIHNSHTMIDTLSMEALTHVQIAYSDLIPDLHALPSAYKQTALALRVGKSLLFLEIIYIFK